MMNERQNAVSEILACAIVTCDDDAAQIICNSAEVVAAGFTTQQMDEAKARAVALVLALDDVPEPGPVDKSNDSIARWAHSDVAPSWFDPTAAGERWDDDY